MDGPLTNHSMVPAASAVRVAHCRDPMPWHSHAGTVMVLIDGGERTLATREAFVRMPAGRGVVIPAGQAHAWIPEGTAGCSYRAIRIASAASRPMPAGVLDDPSWRTAFEAAFAAVAGMAPEAATAVDALVQATRVVLPQPWRPPVEPGAVRRARQLLQSKGEHRLRLADLARAAGMSACHLQRLYRRLWGVTPAQHGLEVRLRVARLALLDGASVATAAAAAGFADQSHLTRAFRRFMGVPPEQWRRQVMRPAGAVHQPRT